MPLVKSGSKKAFGQNVAKEKSSGKDLSQALAIAYATKRKYGKKGKMK